MTRPALILAVSLLAAAPSPRPTPTPDPILFGNTGTTSIEHLTYFPYPASDLSFAGPPLSLTLKPVPIDVDIPQPCALAVGMAILRRESIEFYRWAIEAKKACPLEVVR